MNERYARQRMHKGKIRRLDRVEVDLVCDERQSLTLASRARSERVTSLYNMEPTARVPTAAEFTPLWRTFARAAQLANPPESQHPHAAALAQALQGHSRRTSDLCTALFAFRTATNQNDLRAECSGLIAELYAHCKTNSEKIMTAVKETELAGGGNKTIAALRALYPAESLDDSPQLSRSSQNALAGIEAHLRKLQQGNSGAAFLTSVPSFPQQVPAVAVVANATSSVPMSNTTHQTPAGLQRAQTLINIAADHAARFTHDPVAAAYANVMRSHLTIITKLHTRLIAVLAASRSRTTLIETCTRTLQNLEQHALQCSGELCAWQHRTLPFTASHAFAVLHENYAAPGNAGIVHVKRVSEALSLMEAQCASLEQELERQIPSKAASEDGDSEPPGMDQWRVDVRKTIAARQPKSSFKIPQMPGSIACASPPRGLVSSTEADARTAANGGLSMHVNEAELHRRGWFV